MVNASRVRIYFMEPRDVYRILAHHKSRISGRGQALVIPRGSPLYFMFIDLLKFQISNPNADKPEPGQKSYHENTNFLKHKKVHFFIS